MFSEYGNWWEGDETFGCKIGECGGEAGGRCAWMPGVCVPEVSRVFHSIHCLYDIFGASVSAVVVEDLYRLDV